MSDCYSRPQIPSKPCCKVNQTIVGIWRMDVRASSYLSPIESNFQEEELSSVYWAWIPGHESEEEQSLFQLASSSPKVFLLMQPLYLLPVLLYFSLRGRWAMELKYHVL
jgi:hypothetical protein